MFTVYITRHATPDWNRKDLPYDLPPGPPLVPQGEIEAAQLGEFFKKVSLQQMFVSPFERTRRTAEIAATVHKVPFRIEPGLAEWSPQETEAQVWKRMEPVFKQAARLSVDQGPVALVTHGGPIGLLLSRLGLSKKKVELYSIYDYHNPLPPAGAWLASRVSEEEPWTLKLVFEPQREFSGSVIR